MLTAQPPLGRHRAVWIVGLVCAGLLLSYILIPFLPGGDAWKYRFKDANWLLLDLHSTLPFVAFPFVLLGTLAKGWKLRFLFYAIVTGLWFALKVAIQLSVPPKELHYALWLVYSNASFVGLVAGTACLWGTYRGSAAGGWRISGIIGVLACIAAAGGGLGLPATENYTQMNYPAAWQMLIEILLLVLFVCVVINVSYRSDIELTTWLKLGFACAIGRVMMPELVSAFGPNYWNEYWDVNVMYSLHDICWALVAWLTLVSFLEVVTARSARS